jgi:hypothetical protein
MRVLLASRWLHFTVSGRKLFRFLSNTGWLEIHAIPHDWPNGRGKMLMALYHKVVTAPTIFTPAQQNPILHNGRGENRSEVQKPQICNIRNPA